MKIFIHLLATIILAQCFSSATNDKCDRQETSTKNIEKPYVQKEQKKAENHVCADFSVDETCADSATVTRIIKGAAQLQQPEKDSANKQKLLLHIARSLIGVPYVAQTLEVNNVEKLVVNLRQLDCTTYVENVLAIYLCIKNNTSRYSDFKSFLRQLRYVDGKVSYPTRQHYFTEWIEENTNKGFVYEIQSPNPPFTAIQNVRINYMSNHYTSYPMLKANPQMVKPIAQMEKKLTGRKYRYIPKSEIRNNSLYRQAIHDGDIIAITTKKEGLDTSHIGIAVWHKDGLHMLNASQIHKKVVEEPMTLYQYMQKHPSQTGIRIIRVE